MNRSFSLYLDLLRVGAAIVVLVTHLAYVELSGGMLLPWRLVGNDAVMLFFVLSGYVIAYVADAKETDARDYLLSRLARLWSVAVPALFLTIAFDQMGRLAAPEAYESWWYAADAPLLRIASALSFTNELWFQSVRPFSNGPFWSLGYEFAYYMIFAALAFARGPRRWLLAGGLALLAGPKIMLLFPVWWLGVLVYRRTREGPVPVRTGLACFALPVLLYACYRWSGAPAVLLEATRNLLGAETVAVSLRFSDEFVSSYAIGALVAIHFVGAHALAHRLRGGFGGLERPIRWLAGSTFTIYLLHYPLLRLIGAAIPYDRNSAAAVFLVFAATLAICVAVGSAVEPRKAWLRARLERLFQRRTAEPLAPQANLQPSP